MKLKLFLMLFIQGIIIFFSCTSLKRYSSTQPSAADNELASIDLFGFRLSEAKQEDGNKTLWDLSADAQSQFIKILNTRYPDNEQFLKAMSFKYMEEEAPPLPYDYISKDLRLVFSISKQRNYGKKDNISIAELSPADRIEYLKITLRIPDEFGVRFTGWNMFTTEYGSIDIADVSFSRSLELDASGLLLTNKKAAGRELSAGGKSSASRKEDQEIKYRYLKLNGRINKNEIEMEEEGTREIDLTGNITADLSLEFEKFPEMITDFSSLKDSSGRFNKPKKLIIQHSYALVPRLENVKDTLFAELKMDYVFRNVISGQKTFPEWDDRVKYYYGSVSKTIPLFTPGDYVPDFYSIGTDRNSDGKDFIKIQSPGNKEYNLVFRTYRDAVAFHEWLSDYFYMAENRNKYPDIGGYRLKFRDMDLVNEMFEDLSIIPFYR
jgi:hypothetical protein